MSIDLDDIERRIADGIYGDDRMTKEGRNDAFSALNEIIAEVERLRAGLADIEQIVLDGMAVTRHDGIAEGERRATERIVAWLRAHGTWCAVCEASAREYADCIERGEHRREGKD